MVNQSSSIDQLLVHKITRWGSRKPSPPPHLPSSDFPARMIWRWTTEFKHRLIFCSLQNGETQIAVVQRVVGDAGADTDTFCRWIMSQKMELGGPLSGICHWFVNPDKKLHRPRIGNYHINRHVISSDGPDMALDSVIPSDLMSSNQLHESTSISIIMLLATVLFILLITAFVTCITRKTRAAQVNLQLLPGMK